MSDKQFCLFTSSPIDTFEDFHHISMVHLKILDFVSTHPYHCFTYFDVWREIMDKLHWAWCVCKEVDTRLRSSDVYVHLSLYEKTFVCSVLFKSDNNGTTNLIMDDTPDAKTRALDVPHEFDCDWELVCIEGKGGK